MSDHSNMSIESPASSRAATPPIPDASRPLRVLPIGLPDEGHENEAAALLQTNGVTPMSPRTVANTLANHNVLDAEMLRVITRGLIATIRERESKSFEERNKYVGRINQLEDQLNERARKVYDDNTPPENFEENDDNKAPVSRVPDGEGDYVVPKWVRFLDDGRVAAYAYGAPKDSLPYVIDLYAEPHLDDEVPFNPMPHWYRAVLNADEARFQVLYCETAKRGHWGHLAELKRHRDTSRTVRDLQARIAYMEADLEGAVQARELSEFRLQAARAHELVEHAQGLLSQGLRFTPGNRDAMRFLGNSKDKKRSRGRLED